MRPVASMLAAALLSGGAVYGLLAAVRPASVSEEDPWLEAWIRAGLHVQFRSASAEPDKHLQLRLQRERFEQPEFAGTRLRSYSIHGVRAQVVELPSANLRVFDDPDRPEEEGAVQYGNGDTDHYSRRGRYLLVVAEQQRVAFWPLKMPKETRGKAVQAFRGTAERLSRPPAGSGT
jgi:hypothetical protein